MLRTYELVYQENGTEKKEVFSRRRTMAEFWEKLEEQYENAPEEALIRLAENEQELPPEQLVFVNVYSVTRHYGGPEEGGWWFDALHCEEIMPVQYQYAETLREELKKRYEESHKWGDISSVLGGQDVVVYIEKDPKESETKERPVYE